MNRARQFRILYRHFLFRLMDVELLAASAHGDAGGFVGQFGALLISTSAVVAWIAAMMWLLSTHAAPPQTVWTVERMMVSLTMLAAGVFALLSWDAIFPDRRDVQVMGPLPVRAGAMFAAKMAGGASALVLVVAALNCFSGFAWPLVIAPDHLGFFGTLRFLAAFWTAMLAAGAFVYGAVLAVHAAAAQLPRRWYLRISPIVQMAVFAAMLAMFLLAAEGPPYWFAGLASELSGLFRAKAHAAMAPLAARAAISVAAAVTLAGAGYALAYLRTLRQILEEPDATPGARGGIPLPRFGTQPQTALAQFAIRTLGRSRQHRMIVAFYLGGGFALVTLYVGLIRKVMWATGLDLLHQVNAPALVVSLLVLSAAMLGTRAVFAVPLDLRANWLFRLAPTPATSELLAAARRALWALAVLPVWAATAAVLLWFWPWRPALGHLAVLALVGSALADALLVGFRKIPFTCSYLPGKRVHQVFWVGVIPLVLAIHKLVEKEQDALQDWLKFAVLVAPLAIAAVAARRISGRSVEEDVVQFEEAPAEEVTVLGLGV